MQLKNLFKLSALALFIGFTTSAYAIDYNCYGTYNRYEDSCYSEVGGYTNYNYVTGRRIQHGDNGAFTLFDWNNGSHLGSHSGYNYNGRNSYSYNNGHNGGGYGGDHNNGGYGGDHNNGGYGGGHNNGGYGGDHNNGGYGGGHNNGGYRNQH